MTLEQPSGKWAEDLIVILNTDHTLNNGAAPKSVVEFESYCKMATKRNNADISALVTENRAIGLGMIAHRDYVAKSARLSFWIGSDYLTDENIAAAFTLFCERAKALELDAIIGTMSIGDEWLIHAWESSGALRLGNAYDGHITMMLRFKEKT